MSGVLYKVCQNRVEIENEEYISYGISCNGEVIASNISTDRDFVSGLTNAFNDNDVAPSQIMYLIEDVL